MIGIWIAGFVITYLLIGVVFLLCYILALKPSTQDVQLGLIALFWPLIILIDVTLALGTQLGAVTRKLSTRFHKKS